MTLYLVFLPDGAEHGDQVSVRRPEAARNPLPCAPPRLGTDTDGRQGRPDHHHGERRRNAAGDVGTEGGERRRFH